MPRFALEPGETEIHRELARLSGRSAALTLTERRLVCVCRREATGIWRTLAAHVSADRHIVEIRREDFERLEVDETDALRGRTHLAFHARTGVLRVVVASAGETWQRRVERWAKGDDLPTIALPRADVRTPKR